MNALAWFLWGVIAGVTLADLTHPSSDLRLWIEGKPPIVKGYHQ